jgi:predicted Ser/Thr protein kinase
MENSMPPVAGTYQIVRQIGSGGGGVVYLAEHLRLGKKVVLKADKRTLSAKPDLLRREVDALKNLSHTNIPQVYDFVEEGGTVYTVMDFIEGESLDKPLKRGERFAQSQVIEWACQLLDALVYLHGRPPHGILHADIKPSNIMLTPQGDVRLIDFNIALALGEEGSVAVGRSFGYASPEHYGLDYSSGYTTQVTATDVLTDISPDTVAGAETVLESKPQSSVSGTASRKTILLNVRSDIYSLGATLYHILSGMRPAQNANEVAVLPAEAFSQTVIAIIAKAMSPNPNLRYQSAEEMLYALERLRENDPRTRRWKHMRNLAGVAFALTFLAGGLTAFAGLRQGEAVQRAQAEAQRVEAEAFAAEAELQRIEAERQQAEARLQELHVLAAQSADAMRSGDRTDAIAYALDALSEDIPYIAEGQKALTDALGVYDVSDGYKAHLSVAVPGEVIKLAVSPDETIAAAMTLGKLIVFEPETGGRIAELPTVDSALADVLFLDGETILYAGADGLTAFSATELRPSWTGGSAVTVAASADGAAIAAVGRDEGHATVYGADGSVLRTVSFGERRLRAPVNDRLTDPEDNLFALNADGSLLGVSFSDGSLELLNLKNSEDNIVLFETSEYTHFEGGFHGNYFVFSATNSEESLFAAIDTEALEQTDSFTAPERIGVTADESGVYLSFRDKRTKYDPATLEESDPEFGRSTPLYRYDYGVDSQDIKITKLVSNADKDIFHYDSFYDHAEARLSEDGQTVMLFGIEGFRLYGIGGETIAEVSLEEGIYDQQYRRVDGQSYLEVTWYNGTVHKYSASDGTLFHVEHIAPPDESLYEEFFTDALRIASPLHGTPVAYDRVSGEQVRELEKNAYLTYVTQLGEYIVTEYIRAEDGSRYGLLLNGDCETLAVLPGLCDVLGKDLIFDFHTGELRKTRLYTIQELIGLAR